MVTKWERGSGGVDWEIGTDIYILICIEQLTIQPAG